MKRSTTKARYADGFVIPLSKKKISEYRQIAKKAGKVWMEHGAIEYCECVSEDMKVFCGISFAKLAKLKKGEVVIFSWITYKSRAHRDRVNAKVMRDPRLAKMMDPKNPPFDIDRMSYGGFEIIVNA